MDAARADAVGVTLAHVEKSFGDVKVLNDVSFSIGAGTVLCIIGPPGAGKSTLLRCIGGLEAIDRGTIRFGGEPAGPADAVTAPLIGGRPGLSGHMTALQQIIEGPLAGLKRSRGEMVARAMAALERVGLADRRDAYPDELSGGQCRRVAIARALAMKPGLILFDAPTTGLDPDEVGAVLDVIRGLAAGGVTVIVATDDLDFVREVADEVVFMDKGAIARPAPGLAMRAGLP